MKTNLSAEFLATESGARANEILRSCVHCGFCNATCPTYQLTGDELDGPRGRIYLIRELLEGGDNEDRATRHLDRCLTCRACETTCPSGVAYGELAEIAREQLGPEREGQAGRLRALLRWMVPDASRLRLMSRIGKLFLPLLPKFLANSLPTKIGQPLRSNTEGEQTVVIMNGCAQQVSTASTNEALARLLQAHDVGVQTLTEESCCGSFDLHLGDSATALAHMKRNIDALMPLLPKVQAIVSTASGCGVTLKDYGRLLAHDSEYAESAAQVSAAVQDVSEFLASVPWAVNAARDISRVAWHAPCTLQHGQQINGVVETLLQQAGYTLTAVPDAHLCCGSAGTYSLLEPELAGALKRDKLAALQSDQPQIVATANVGCQTHLAADAGIEVVHWIELLK